MKKDIDSRRMQVETLSTQGYTSDEIAEMLEVPGRTIRRDLEVIRSANILARTDKTMAGDIARVLARADKEVGGLHRVANDKSASHIARLNAHLGAWRVTLEAAKFLQSMGYLPSAAKEINANLNHHVSRQDSFSAMNARVVEFEKAVKEAGRMDEEAEKEIAALKAIVAASQESQAISPDVHRDEAP